MTASLRSLIDAQMPALIALRHDLHRHPELFFQEKRTSGIVQRELAALNIEFKAGMATTGVVAHLPASGPASAPSTSGAIALRADMDALPILEQTGRPYASTNSGVMHACGHDGHTTILIGAARILSQIERPNPVTLIFQPAEESGAGADVLCRAGALAGAGKGGLGPPVSRIFGLHGWPQLPLGMLATKPGPLLAATDEFTVTVRGEQSHGAYPHLGRDPIVAAAHAITALQTIASRNVSPMDAVVVTVGVINAGTANNIIPEEVRFQGTVRTLRAATRTFARERFFAVVEQTCAAFGCAARIEWHDGYPMTDNDAAATRQFFEAADRVVGPDRALRIDEASMGGEDFSYYGRHARACFFLLGLMPHGMDRYPTLHQPDFDFNDDALALGVEMMCTLATSRF